MSTIKDEEILITFDELRQLDKDDISVCVDKYSALSICEKSSATPVEIYNIWVQKLFKAYDMQEFSNNDWHRILEYLDKVLKEFVKNFIDTTNDNAQNHLERWWLDTQNLLQWLETIINTLDIRILCLILTFVLEVIIKTCKFGNKGNLKILCNIQQMVINLSNKFIFKMPITEENEFESYNKVLSSLCDVGSFISSADIKTSIETWRIVAKLGDKLNTCSKSFPNNKIENYRNTDEKQWYEKAILGISKELYEILNHYKMNAASCNDNLLQVCQFYLKLLRMIINFSKDKLKVFPATKIFIDIYTLSHHEFSDAHISKIDLYINKGLFEILELIYREDNMAKAIMLHFKSDMDNFKSCDLITDYLKVYIENYCKNRFNDKLNIEELMELYNFIFEGPILFIDSIRYPKILEYFVVITILDSSNEVHKKLCEYVLDSYWIRSYASMEIINIYYSYILEEPNSVITLKCLEFWLQIWNKLNRADASYKQQKMLTEVLLKTILNNINEDKLLQYSNCNKYENIEIISLMCGKENQKNVQYFLTNLNNNLKKIQERHINGRAYRELLNLLEICAMKPQLINYNLKETIFTTFTGLFALKTTEFSKFYELFNKCLIYFERQQDKQLNEKLLKYLMQHEQHCCSFKSIFLIEFLLKQRPQSTKLLQTLKTYNKENLFIINLLDLTSFSNKETHIRNIDLKIFQDLSKTYQQSSNPINIDQEQIRKKPRLDSGNFSNIKFILNDMNINSQKLLNFDRSLYDTKDYELLQQIKNNIEKCLLK